MEAFLFQAVRAPSHKPAATLPLPLLCRLVMSRITWPCRHGALWYIVQAELAGMITICERQIAATVEKTIKPLVALVTKMEKVQPGLQKAGAAAGGQDQSK